MKPGFHATCPACGQALRCDDPVELIYHAAITGESRPGWYLPCGYCPELVPIPARKVEAVWSKTALAASRRILELRAQEPPSGRKHTPNSKKV